MKSVLILNFPENPDKHRLFLVRHFLRQNGYEVGVLGCDVWKDEKYRFRLAEKPWILLGINLEYAKYLRRIISTFHREKFDFILIGYPAIIDLLFIRLFFPGLKERVYVDYFLSFYDTIVSDRHIYSPTGFIAKTIYVIDKIFLRLSLHIITDTWVNARRYQRMFRLKVPEWHRILVGSRLLTEPVEWSQVQITPARRLKIGWVGAFIPLHGIEIILQSAEKLKEEAVDFLLIGDGQEFLDSTKFIAQNKLEHVSLAGRLPYETAMQLLQSCDICLGIFGKSAKAGSVIPIKIFDYLCLGKWIITQNSGAFDELPPLVHIIRIENNPEELCQAIRHLATNPQLSTPLSVREMINEMVQRDVRSTFQ